MLATFGPIFSLLVLNAITAIAYAANNNLRTTTVAVKETVTIASTISVGTLSSTFDPTVLCSGVVDYNFFLNVNQTAGN